MINVERGYWLALLSAVCCYTANAQAQVFKCVDPDGHVIFTDTDCGSTKQEVEIVQSCGGLSTAPTPATGLSSQEQAALGELEAREAEIAAQRAAGSAIGGSHSAPAPAPSASTAPKSSY
jgi:Domain of unknown function (DUF4124)